MQLISGNYSRTIIAIVNAVSIVILIAVAYNHAIKHILELIEEKQVRRWRHLKRMDENVPVKYIFV